MSLWHKLKENVVLFTPSNSAAMLTTAKHISLCARSAQLDGEVRVRFAHNKLFKKRARELPVIDLASGGDMPRSLLPIATH